MHHYHNIVIVTVVLVCIITGNNQSRWLPWRVLASTGQVLCSTHFFAGTMGTVDSTIGGMGYYGYCTVPVGTTVVPTGTRVL